MSLKYSFGSPATEEVSMEPGEIDNKAWNEPISAGAHLQVFSGVVIGLVKSITKRFIAKGMPADEINSKARMLLNEFVQNGDLDNRFKTWMFERDFSDDQWDLKEELEKARPPCEYGSWYVIYDEAKYGVRDGQWNVDYRQKMNDREKALVDALSEARQKLYQAERAYNDYVNDHVVVTINDVFIKYGEILSKMDKEWYDGVESCLKTELALVEKRRKEKLAEEDSTSERPVEV